MGARQIPVRRSELTCPGHSSKMMAGAAASGADEVIFDLEDACATSQKEAARGLVIEALTQVAFSPGTVRAVRVNDVRSGLCYRDVVDVVERAGAKLDVLVIPKVERASDVEFVSTLVDQLEIRCQLPRGRIGLEVLIETASAVLHAPAIAGASPRLESLIFGVADYAASVGARDFNAAAQFHYPRASLLAAARAAGVLAIDAVTVQFRDLDKTRADADAAAAMGFDGKWAIHPGQLAPIHAAFTPTVEEVNKALATVQAYREADAREGLGAIVLDGEMVDAATVKVLEKRLQVARRAGLTR